MTKHKFALNYATLTVAWLKTLPPGTHASTAQIAQALGVTGKNRLQNLRDSMRTSEAIRRVHVPGGGGRNGGFVAFWSLAEFEPLPKPKRACNEDRELLPRRTSFPEIQPHPGMLFPGVYA